jgi:hypothetical protein
MPLLLLQCVMCFRTASSQQIARAHVLNEGIIMLGIPPMLILLGFAYLAYRDCKGAPELIKNSGDITNDEDR